MAPFMQETEEGRRKLHGARIWEAIIIAVVIATLTTFSSMYVNGKVFGVEITTIKHSVERIEDSIDILDNRLFEHINRDNE